MSSPLSPDRWARVLDLFHDALDRPARTRTAFLRDACRNDPGLLLHVQALLDADTDTDSLLRTAGWADGLAVDHGSLTGTHVGPYRIGVEIGRGGMGVVYRATRDDVGTTVAVKVLRERFPSSNRLRRFLAEQRTLGRLVHPGIARFLDAGVTDDGTPFFVMEHVDGVPLPRYCDDHSLDVTARLRLFQAVCDAVRYAHANLVVHRDLKPSNVLVTEIDGVPQVKLLDFGIAKLLTDDRSTGLTRTGEHLLTPAYAAPEQISDEPGGAISTATDVYALGALLYELLAGRPPIDVAGAPLPEVARRILQTAPPAPSTVATQAGRLRGDLDTICLTALRKNPARRYASVDALRDDVGRVLDDRPITARRDTFSYRTGKFLRRNRPAVLVTGLVALLVGALVVFYTVRLAGERDRAQREAATSAAVVEFLVETLDDGNPNAAGGDTLTISDVVDRAERRARTFNDEPLVRASVLDAVARVRLMHGRYADADSLYHASLALRRAALGSAHPEAAASLTRVGDVRIHQGRYPEADSVLTASLATLRAAAADDLLVAEALNLLAKSRMQQNQLSSADSLYTAALLLRARHLPATDRRIVNGHLDRGRALLMAGDLDAAASNFRRAFDGFTALHPRGHTLTAAALTNLATVDRMRGHYGRADSLYAHSLAMMRRLVGPVHPDVASVLNNMGANAYHQGDFETAARYFRETMTVREQLLGPTHPEVAAAHNNLGVVFSMTGDLDAAERHYRTAQAIRAEALGEMHPHTITTLNNLAGLYENRGDYATAEAMRRDVLARYRAALPPAHPRIALALNNVGSLLRKAGRLEAAEPYLTEALALRREILSPEHAGIALVLENLGALYDDQARWADAEAAYREALTIRRAATPDHWRTALAARDLGHALLELGRYAEAEPLLLDGHTGLAAHRGPDDVATTDAAAFLTRLYTAWDRPERLAALSPAATDAGNADAPSSTAPVAPRE